jgi:hypothetical protein
VAISPVNGDIFVADAYNHRVQVFEANRDYKATLGMTGNPGSGNEQFNYPWDIAIDTAGNVYVADYDNYRVQKCSLGGSSYSCQTLIGETGVYDYEFSQVVPRSVAVDASGRVYVADDWSSTLKVFDHTGAFLTSVGGEWGSNTSQFSSVGAIAFDSNGDVYVVDPDNHRIQKFTIGVPDWTQVNINGFGERVNFGVGAMEIFNGQMYLGTRCWFGEGGAVYRSPDGTAWTRVSEPGFGDDTNVAVIDMIEFNGQLYAGTGWGDVGLGKIWRSADGESWTPVVGDGFNNPDNIAVLRFVIYDGFIYAATHNVETGAEIYRSPSGNIGSWDKVLDEGNESGNNTVVNSFAVFAGELYAAGENTADGAEIWRTSNGTVWIKVNENGFGNSDNIHIGSIIEFKGALYASTRNDNGGGEIWRSSNGTAWTRIVEQGFYDGANYKIEALYVHNQQMFVVANNAETGLKVWRTDDGASFTQLIDDGFGDSNNRNTLWDASIITFKNRLYIGTFNSVNGGELWRYGTDYNTYLPLIVK